MKHRSSQANISDSSEIANGTNTWTHVWRDDGRGTWAAYKATPLGIVDMESANFGDSVGVTRLVFYYAGRRWEREFDRLYSPLWAARLATEFARDVVEGRVGE